jgi:hypothetical protein
MNRESNKSIIEKFNKIAPGLSVKVVGEPVAEIQEQKTVANTINDNLTIKEPKKVLITTSLALNMVLTGEINKYRINDSKLFIERADAKTTGHPLRIAESEFDTFVDELIEVRQQWRKRVMDIE